MQSSRRVFRLLVLALIGVSLTSCHFYRNGYGGCGGGGWGWGPRHCAPHRYCR